jgi:hypothetical protein
MISTLDIAWLAGLLEGEGCFTADKRLTIRISVAMTDLDVIERARKLMKCTCKIQEYSPGACKRNKTLYRVLLNGTPAAQWAMTLYPFMGVRRQTKIRELIADWKSRYSRGSVLCRMQLHRLEGINIITNKDGSRKCRTCYNATALRNYHERKARAA